MKKLVFATNNPNKLAEVQQMLPQFEIVGLKDIGCTEDISETATTLQGNAQIKADFVTQNYGFDCFADDTGLEVEALDNAPGVYSARYAGEPSNAENNMQKLLLKLQDKTNRKAQFRTVICLNINNEQHLFEGICKGSILNKKYGEKGFGYDPIFRPNCYSLSFAQMTAKEKNNISHRGLAINKLVSFFKGSALSLE